MRSRRVLALSTLAAAGVAGATLGGTASAGDADDDGDKNVLLAEAQFQLFLVTADFEPSDITCTRPPVRDVSGELLCYALISDRISVAAIATRESPGTYTFVPLNKVDLTVVDEVAPPAEPQQPSDVPDTPSSEGAADEAIVASIDIAIADTEGLTEVLTENNPSIASLDVLAYHAPTSTVQVNVTTNVADPGARDAVAFYVTDVLAYLWMESEPLRDSAATIHPRLEVTVDEVLYGTPFEVMVDVADYAITESEWLAIVTGNAAFQADQPAIRAALQRVANTSATTSAETPVKTSAKIDGKPVTGLATGLLVAGHGST